MSRARARTGLSKARTVERELLEVRWRENGGAKQSGAPAYFNDNQDAALRLTYEYHNFPEAVRKPPAEINRLEDALLVLQAASGDEVGEGIFAEALAVMRSLGFGGADGLARAFDAIPVDGADAAIEAAYEQGKARGLSDRAAMEHAAADLGIPASSFDGAVALVKRKLREVALDARPRRRPMA